MFGCARLVSSITLRLTHGLTIQTLDDPVIHLVEEVIGDFSKMSAPGAYLVDSFPSRESFCSS